MKTFYLFIGFVIISSTLMPVSISGQVAAGAHASLGGVWVLDRDRGTAGRGDAGGAEPGTRDGREGGRRGDGGGGFGGRQVADPERLQALANYLRTSMTPSDRLTIVVKDSAVDIVEADGARLALQTDNKKIEERAENGLVKLTRKSHWNGNQLATEIDIDNGPTVERTYAVSSTGSELQISTTLSGGAGGRGGRRGNRPVVQVYERFEPTQP